jgi:hypothetical protein
MGSVWDRSLVPNLSRARGRPPLLFWVRPASDIAPATPLRLPGWFRRKQPIIPPRPRPVCYVSETSAATTMRRG